MAPFRWQDTPHDIALAREVAANRPQKSQDWEAIADALSKDFSNEDRKVELNGRAKTGCSCLSPNTSQRMLEA